MKVAVLGDVHANFTALEAVTDHVERWKPDVVISAGDIINRGPSSRECLDLIRRKSKGNGWRTLKGNHEDYVIHQATPEAERDGPLFECFRQSFWTLKKINNDVSTVRDWEDVIDMVGPGESILRVAHGSALGNNLGIYPRSSDEDLVAKGGEPAPAVFCGGHTHTAFSRRVGDTLFVNAGSVGIPFDGNWRAGYAQLTFENGTWQENIVRLEYDREKTLLEYVNSGFLTEAGPVAWLVLGEYLFARSQLFAWHRDYFDLVLRGEREIEETVREQLERQGMWSRVRGYL
jgi:putative phosphoesterase